METVPHHWTDRNRFPDQAEWPWVFISEAEVQSDALPVPYWNRPPAGSYLPLLLRKIQTAPDHEQVLTACQTYAVQAAHHSDNPGEDTVKFAAWFCARHGSVEARIAYSDDLQLGREIRPTAAFLAVLCGSKPWNDAANILRGRRASEQSPPPMPPDLKPFFESDQTPPPEPLHPLRDPHTGQLRKHVSVQEAAAYANVTERHIRRLMAEGRLPHHGLKKHRRPFVKDLIEWFGKPV
jgi:excisionase family DNA binding protein